MMGCKPMGVAACLDAPAPPGSPCLADPKCWYQSERRAGRDPDEVRPPKTVVCAGRRDVRRFPGRALETRARRRDVATREGHGPDSWAPRRRGVLRS